MLCSLTDHCKTLTFLCFENADELKVSNNKFTGSLPDEFYNIETLEFLDCSGNMFSGTISPMIQAMNISKLFLGGNAFIGSVPFDLADLNISIIELHSNNFTGILPPDICNLYNESLTVLTADCLGSDQSPPEIDCACCTLCCNNEIGHCLPNYDTD